MVTASSLLKEASKKKRTDETSAKKSIGEKADAQNSTANNTEIAEPNLREKDNKPGFSSLLTAPSTAGTRLLEQKKKYVLPISKQEIVLDLMEIDPTRAFASKLNPRIQKLLSLEDPKLKSIRQSLKVDGQMEPAYARPVHSAEGISYEIIVGTTRRFLCEDIANELKGFKLQIWVGDIPDIDALKMARMENKERRDLSFWEKCVDAKEQSETSSFEAISKAQQATMMGMSEGAYTEALAAANNFPPEFMQLLKSPDLLGNNAARRILKVIAQQKDKTKLIAGVVKASGNRSITDTKQLETLISNELTLPKKNKSNVWAIESDGVCKVKLTQHRTNQGQFKIDLFGMSEEDIERIKTFLKSATKP